MDYLKIYDALIDKRRKNPLKRCGDFSVELHHIKPRSCGGTDDKDNLVNLTLREHYIAHLLLVKIAQKLNDKSMISKMCLAVFYLVNGKKHQPNGIHMNSHIYAFLKRNQIPVWLGRHHSDKSRAKTRSTMTKDGVKGKRTWLHRGNVVKYVRNELVDEFLRNGFDYGRPGYKPRKGMHGKTIKI